MKEIEVPLQEGKFYHVYNRGNNRENLFHTPENYRYFLRKYDEYLSKYVDTYSYCLLPNHFHLLIAVKEEDDIRKVHPLTTRKVLPLSTGKVLPFQKVVPLEPKVEPLEKIISFQFRKFFTSYAMSINKQEGRTGSLLQKNFKRKEVDSTTYLSNLVFYIHANPQQHGIIDDFRMYPWSSYNGILANSPTKLKRDNVLSWFNDKENYLAYHSQKMDISNIKNLIIED